MPLTISRPSHLYAVGSGGLWFHVYIQTYVLRRTDLPPPSRTNIMAAKSVNPENDGHEKEPIISFIKQAEAGLPIKELCRKGGFSDATFYKWRAKYGGMDDLDDGKYDAQLEACASPLSPAVPEHYDTLKPFDVEAWLKRKV